MTVLLVIATFVLFLGLDYFLSKRRQGVAIEVRPEVPATIAARVRPTVVAGFDVPDNVRYHPGHTWALSESPNLVRVGMDDFAARISGKVDRITLPQRGQWVRQGQKIATLNRDGATVDMVSPIEGSVMEINEAVLANPEAARKDPYGEGWLMKVNSPDAKTNFRNLLGGTTARWWMEESAARLRRLAPQGALALAQDGGEAMDDLTAGISAEEWEKRGREFFLG